MFTTTDPEVITITPRVISNDRKLQFHLQRCKQMPTQPLFYHNCRIMLCNQYMKMRKRCLLEISKITKTTKNANFHNSTSCRSFDEVKTCQNRYQPFPIITRNIAIVANDPEYHQNAMKSHVIVNLSADILTRGLLT